MRPDRPLIVAVASLATGVGLIVAYCQGKTNLNFAYPFSGSELHLDLTTYGPAALGGFVLILLGIGLLVWALLAAIVHQISLLADGHDRRQRFLEPKGEYEDERYPGTLGLTQHRHEG